MEHVGKFFVGILISLVSTLINVWIAGYVFSWILTPVYGILAPSFGQMFVFFMLWGAIKLRFGKEHDEMKWEDGVRYAIIANLSSLLFFGLAAIVAAVLL